MTEQQVQELVAVVRALQADLGAARAETARAQATAAEAQEAVRRGQAAQGAALPGERMAAEMKMIGKPEMFDGAKPPWRDWSVVFEAFAGASHPPLAAAMAAAARSANPVLVANMDQQGAEISRQLGYWLIQTCRGQALDIVLNAGRLEGLEAWRQLHSRFEPQAASRFAGQLMGLLSWDFSGDLTTKLESFERELSLYAAQSGEEMADAIKIGVVLRQLPESPLRQHMIMNAERLRGWPAFREEIWQVRRAQAAAAAAATGAGPMDLSAFNKGGGKGRCSICNGKGRSEKDCWYKKDKGGRHKGHPKGGKSDAKGGHGGKGSRKGDKDKSGGKGKGQKPK